MRKAKLPLPVLILISAALFLFSSAFGEWIGRPSIAQPTPAGESIEQQQTAIVYVRVISWLSQLISRPASPSEVESECAHGIEPSPVSAHSMGSFSVQLCAMSRPPHLARSACKSSRWQSTIQNARPAFPLASQRTTDN